MSANTIITNHHNLRKFEANANEMYSKQTTTKETQRRQHCRHNDSSSSSSNCNNNNIDYKNNENDWSRRRKGSSSNKSLKLRRNRKTTTTRTTTTTATSTEGAATTRTDDIAKQQHNHKRQDNRIDNLAVALLPTVTVTTTTTRNTSCCCNGSSSSSNFPAFPATPAPLPPPKWHRAAGLLSAYLLNSTLLVLAAKATATMVVGTTAAAVVDADINNNNNATRISNNDGNMSSSSSNSANCSLDFLSLGCISNSSLNASDDALSIDNASEYIFDRTYIRVIFITLYTMVFCCCFFGNLLVILVVTLSRRLRSITNFFLANLAVADFCVGTFCVMQNLSIYLIDSWVFGEFMCRMYQFVHSLSYTASIFILVVICTERYFAIVHPITCKQTLTAPRLRMAVVTVWIASALYSTPKFIFAKTIKNVHTLGGQEEYICVLDRKMFNSKVLDMINFGLLYLIPLLVMMVLYSKIAIALWRSSRGLSHHIASQSHQQENSIGMHNSMYHHHHAHAHAPSHLHGVAAVQNHTQQPPGTPLSGGSGGGGGLSRRQSSKYEKRGVSITESQVSLDADRPIVTACRKTSFYHHAQPAAAPRVHVHNVSHSSNNVLRARRGVVRMLIIFVLTFALCNLPYHARKMWQYWSRSYRGDSNFNALLTPLTFLFSYFNSGVNPLIYAFLSRNFRKGMKELLLCSWKKGKGKSSTNSSMHHKRMALPTHSLPTDTTHIGNEQL